MMCYNMQLQRLINYRKIANITALSFEMFSILSGNKIRCFKSRSLHTTNSFGTSREWIGPKMGFMSLFTEFWDYPWKKNKYSFDMAISIFIYLSLIYRNWSNCQLPTSSNLVLEQDVEHVTAMTSKEKTPLFRCRGHVIIPVSSTLNVDK